MQAVAEPSPTQLRADRGALFTLLRNMLENAIQHSQSGGAVQQGDRIGQYSIRINDQYRLCFEWTAEGNVNVEIVDYH